MSDLKKLGELLLKSREKAGLTQSEVAKTLNYSSAQFISNWERGVSYPPVKVLKKLTELYKINPDDLFELILSAVLKSTESSLRHEYKRQNRRR